MQPFPARGYCAGVPPPCAVFDPAGRSYSGIAMTVRSNRIA